MWHSLTSEAMVLLLLQVMASSRNRTSLLMSPHCYFLINQLHWKSNLALLMVKRSVQKMNGPMSRFGLRQGCRRKKPMHCRNCSSKGRLRVLKLNHLLLLLEWWISTERNSYSIYGFYQRFGNLEGALNWLLARSVFPASVFVYTSDTYQGSFCTDLIMDCGFFVVMPFPLLYWGKTRAWCSDFVYG